MRKMSMDTGSSLPTYIKRLIDSPEPANLVVPVVSIDDRGLPHPALLSPHEMILRKGNLYFFLSHGSRSSGFLEKRRAVALLFVDPTAATYLKGHARLVGRIHRQSVFRLEITSVLQDFTSAEEGPALIVSSARFEADPELLARRSEIRAEIGDWIRRAE